MTGALVVPFRGLNLWIGTAFGVLKPTKTAARVVLGTFQGPAVKSSPIRIKIYDTTFKNVLEKKVVESYLLIVIKICSASYIICCC